MPTKHTKGTYVYPDSFNPKRTCAIIYVSFKVLINEYFLIYKSSHSHQPIGADIFPFGT